MPGNWVPDFFPGVKVQIFHGLANDRTGKKGHYRIRQLFDLYCTYSDETTRTFQELARRHRTFEVIETGWPKVDPLFREGDVRSLRDEFGTDKPMVLYAATFSPSMTSAPDLPETIERLSKSGKWFWLVTLHPKNKPEIFARYRGMQSPHLKFVDSGDGVLPLLKTADVMLSDTSSIILEVDKFAAAAPVPLLKIYFAARARVYSSPMYVPFSSTIANLSASGS